MIEDELRAAFARHEPHAPAVSVLRPAIARLASRRRRQRLGRRAGGVAVLALAVLLGVPPLVSRAPEVLSTAVPLPAGPLNLLLIGLDQPATDPDSQRSDTIIVVHVPADRNSIYLVSIERDVEVDIPGHGRDKINQAYPIGGEALLGTVIQTMTGVDIDGTVTVTLDGLAAVTDALGGIRVCQPDAIISIHTGRTFPRGCTDLDGAAVADLSRQRFTLPLGAYDRDRNVQRILIAMAEQASHLNVFTDATRLTRLIGVDGVTVVTPTIDPVALVLGLHGISSIIGLSDHHFRPGGNPPNELLDPVVAAELFAALRADTLAQFAANHPDWVLGE
jgi:LCP family protein required for cell wall assembly